MINNKNIRLASLITLIASLIAIMYFALSPVVVDTCASACPNALPSEGCADVCVVIKEINQWIILPTIIGIAALATFAANIFSQKR